METKEAFRERLLQRRRRCFSDAEQKRLGSVIGKRVMEILGEEVLKHVGLYASHRGEVSTEELFSLLRATNRWVYFPKVFDRELLFARVERKEDFSTGSFGIAEPRTGPFVEVGVLEGVVMPGVAFDRQGWRLGLGHGYYDRSLAGFKGVKIGLAYDFQIVDALPHEPHDIPCDYVATETCVIQRH